MVPGAEPSVSSPSSGNASDTTSDTHQMATAVPGSTSVLPGSTSPLLPTDLTNPDNVGSIMDHFGDISPENPLLSEADRTLPTSEPVTAEMDTSTYDPQSSTCPTNMSTSDMTPATVAESLSLNSAPSSNDSSSTSVSTSASTEVSTSAQTLVPNISHSLPMISAASKPTIFTTRSTLKDTQAPNSLQSSAPKATPSPTSTYSSLTSSKPAATEIIPTSSPTTPANSSLSGSGLKSSGSSGCSSGSEPSPGSSGELCYISKYLVQYVAIPKTTKPVAQRVCGARIPTSSECEAILLEREAKKKRKLRRKQERERKKKEREDLQKLKAEQRAKKAEERAKLAEKKAEEQCLRIKKQCAPKAIASSTTKKTKVVLKALSDLATADEPSISLTSSPAEAESATTSFKPSRQRKADHIEPDSDSFDENQCCVCFRTYEDDVVEDTGLDWLQCVCKRWLHEECIDYDIGHDADGNDLLCPFCCI